MTAVAFLSWHACGTPPLQWVREGGKSEEPLFASDPAVFAQHI
jgi:hypothetical protein